MGGAQGFDMTIIEVMPMGDIGNENRVDQYLPLSQVRADLSKRFTLIDSDYQTPGQPAMSRLQKPASGLVLLRR